MSTLLLLLLSLGMDALRCDLRQLVSLANHVDSTLASRQLLSRHVSLHVSQNLDTGSNIEPQGTKRSVYPLCEFQRCVALRWVSIKAH